MNNYTMDLQQNEACIASAGHVVIIRNSVSALGLRTHYKEPPQISVTRVITWAAVIVVCD